MRAPARQRASSAPAGRLAEVPPPFWWLLTGALVNSFGNFVLPFLVTYTAGRGVPVALAGLTLTAYGAGAVVAAVAGGELTDRLGSRTTIAVSMAGSAAATAGLAVVSGLPALMAAASVAGVFANLFRPAGGALIGDLVGPDGRVGAYAAYRLAINLGAAAGSGVAGLLADRSFGLLFAGDAATALVFAAVAAARLPAPRPERAASPPRPDGARPGGVLRDPPFLTFLAAAFLWWLVFYQGLVGLPLQVRALGYPNTVFGALLAVNGALIVCVELPLTRLTRRLPRGPTIAAGAVLIGAGFALLAVARSLPALAGTVVIWTAGEALLSPIASALVMDAAPPASGGRYQGAWTMTRSAALLAAPAVGSLAFGRSPLLLWLGCGAAGAAGAALALGAGAMLRTARRTGP